MAIGRGWVSQDAPGRCPSAMQKGSPEPVPIWSAAASTHYAVSAKDHVSVSADEQSGRESSCCTQARGSVRLLALPSLRNNRRKASARQARPHRSHRQGEHCRDVLVLRSKITSRCFLGNSSIARSRSRRRESSGGNLTVDPALGRLSHPVPATHRVRSDRL